MAALAEAMRNGIWFERPKFEEAEYKYQEYLVRSSTGENVVATPVTGTKKVDAKKEGSVSQQIAQARQKIQNSLKDSSSSVAGEAEVEALRKQVEDMAKENELLRRMVTEMTQKFDKLDGRLSALESQGDGAPSKPVPVTVEEETDDDDDVDLFGSSDEEEDAEAERIRAERLAAYAAKKSKKAAVIAKSSILLDVKPWDDETDMGELETAVRSIEADGLKWGGSQLVKVAFGIQKLQINCVVEDDKVGTDFLEEEITKFEDFVQSVDIAAFNKI
ncbi:elongation factor 1-delta-like isoform X1 [Clavelina lepadiformis]|uniref:elongation factor 1-delta-like isoform X1 n=1 Tax=Clavelina lepadiformis TaxID=159417 RepID=UPI0040410BB3